jgi:hypothetical protein
MKTYGGVSNSLTSKAPVRSNVADVDSVEKLRAASAEARDAGETAVLRLARRPHRDKEESIIHFDSSTVCYHDAVIVTVADGEKIVPVDNTGNEKPTKQGLTAQATDLP